MSCQGTNGCAGTETCKTGNTWGLCVPNGSCQCAPNTNQPCTAADGCAGTQSCVVSGANQAWGTCVDPHSNTFGQQCNSCGAKYGCDGNCDGLKPSMWYEGDSGQINLDFNKSHCTNNQVNWTWSPNFGASQTNPSGHFTVTYHFSAHNNMSNSTSTTFYIGCSSNPTAGKPYNQFQLQTDFTDTSLPCPVGDSVVYYPVQCGESGNCCNNPSVNMDVMSWQSGDAICQ